MNKKKSNSHDQVNALKSFFSLADESIERKLISSTKDPVFENLISTFEEQFYYSIHIKKNKAEIFYSPSVTKITGYNPEELIDFNLLGRELIVEDDLPSVRKRIIAFENSKDDFIELNYRIRRKDGKYLWLNEKVKFITEDDKSGRILALITDITKQKDKETSLNKNIDELKTQIRARDNFLSILSHDLRAPFSSILGFTEILLSDAVLSDAEKTEYLNYINDSSNNQLRLVNYLLDWSNLQTGRFHLEKQRVQAQSIVFNCISSLTGNAMRKNMEIKVNVPESIFVEVDERLLIQVITNLVSNAIKFSDDGRTVYISADRFNNNLVEFVIKDEGIGIPENYHSRIFKFDKMFSTRGTKGERGTGLGLSLVKEIIERHNGQIWFYSKEKMGSEFHFTVPSSDNTILLVENNKEDYLRLERLILENYPGFKFIGTDNGFEAINIVLKQHPSLIISSHNLPLMNGVQFVKSILRGDKKFYAPIIAIVESPDDSLIRSYKEIGIKSILYKPVDLRLFNREVNLALN
jgi:two-component system sensor histidine kinase/response regulator